MKGTGTDLTYNIVEERLYGRIDALEVSVHAVSGGRAGSRTSGAVNIFLANNPYLTHVKKASKSGTGGAIPMRRFWLRCHESRPNWIRLTPMDGEDLQGRDGFAIHGRGPWGSDGCIVPMDPHALPKLCQAVTSREARQSPAPTLAVIAVGDLSRFERLAGLA